MVRRVVEKNSFFCLFGDSLHVRWNRVFPRDANTSVKMSPIRVLGNGDVPSNETSLGQDLFFLEKKVTKK
jgi:hypothetical protein